MKAATTPQALRSSGQHEEKLYLRITGELRTALERSVWKVSDQLPSIETLAQQYSVSIITIRKAIRLLEEEGYLRREQGRGTFVINKPTTFQPHTLNIDKKWSFLDLPDLSAHVETLSRSLVMPPRIFDDLEVRAVEHVHFSRLHSIDNRPYVHIDLFIDPTTYEMNPKAFETIPALQVLSDLDAQIAGGRQRITCRIADTATASILNIQSGTPVVDVARVVFNKKRTAILLAHLTYRADAVVIESSWEE